MVWAGRAETSATGQAAVHSLERCWELWFINSCRLLVQRWEREDAAGFGQGFWVGFGSSEEFASLLANVPGKPFPHQIELLFSGLGPSTLEEGSRKKILPCPRLVSAELNSVLRALAPFP